MRLIFLLVMSVTFCPLPPLPAFGDVPHKPEPNKTEEKELYGDGSLHFRVPLDSKGKRHGQYTAWYPGNKKKIQQRVSYEHGERVGLRDLFDEAGSLIAEEMWVHGKLVLPKSQRIIENERVKLWKEAAASVAKMPKPSNPNAPGAEELARALARINAYRFLCDLPADVVLDDEEINLAQYAAELIEKVGQATHTPEKPAGYDDKAYELGRKGCEHCNLFPGGGAAASVLSYTDDSDKTNIDRLGHRRWLLHPSMATTGFGVSGRFSAMYAFGDSRPETPDYDYVCFPPRGWCPTDMFAPSFAWHISVNPAKYKVGENASLEIFPVDGGLNRASRPLALEYSHVDLGNFGVPNAIIALPPASAVRPEIVYQVVVHGVQTPDGMPADISYYVTFYNAQTAGTP
jgi:hypothetical protein